jgi:hypothetical protein
MGNNGIIGGGEKEPLRMIGRAIIFELPTKKKEANHHQVRARLFLIQFGSRTRARLSCWL